MFPKGPLQASLLKDNLSVDLVTRPSLLWLQCNSRRADVHEAGPKANP